MDPARCKELFLQAVERHPPADWPKFLDQHCDGDVGLRKRIEELLTAHRSGAAAADDLQPPSAASTTYVEPTQVIGKEANTELLSVGHFQIQRLVGRGGMGNIFLAFDEQLERLVALKLPRIDLYGNPGLRKQFLREAQVAAKLRHPGLVEIYEYGVNDSLCFMASRWCNGGDLAAWIEKHPGPHGPQLVANFMMQVCSAVGHCHQAAVLHLDIKPGNIMLERAAGDTGLGTPLLTDFGLSRVVEQSQAETQTSVIRGTPLYMSPEQAECRGAEIGPHTDVFALGVVMFELLHGKRPFSGGTSTEILDEIRAGSIASSHVEKQVPEDLRCIWKVCLQRRTTDRYANATDLGNDLQRFLDRTPIKARPPSAGRRMWYWLTNAERIRHAGIAMLAIQVPGMLSLIILGAAIVLGISPFGSDVAAYGLQAGAIVVGVNVPSAIMGLKAIAGYWWSIPCGLTMSVAYLVTATLMLLQIIPAFDIYIDFPAAAYIATLINSVFAAMQTIVFAMAIPAAIRLHHQNC
ncbi:serine/threonine protein kinase [Roseimaritima ulvae]|uniref:Serine/threonine-protein kinase PrkC n=1 Tax=Roseimaritima ulvae TaxID=980254 RepID=A0A5B9QGM9_9BACT|nr:serine/threonine-protein kinase [Roseimaritima ulvae]QEG38237.1 Serine/threonine-protein kinase PrkC [Roseimaritima ulvae]